MYAGVRGVRGSANEPRGVDTYLMTCAENLASADLSSWLDSVQTWRVTHSQNAASCAPRWQP
jgi:hypothetical protein